MTLTVLIADDHPLFRDGIKAILLKDGRFDIAGEAETGSMAIKLCVKLAPDIVIMDISMPDLNGIEATREIKARNASIKIIALSMLSNTESITEMFKVGASAYLPKECAYKELIEAIGVVLKGEKFISKRIPPELVAEIIASKTEFETDEEPGDREKMIIILTVQEKSIKEIGAILNLPRHVVVYIRKNIMRKLRINSTVGLTKYAIAKGWVKPKE